MKRENKRTFASNLRLSGWSRRLCEHQRLKACLLALLLSAGPKLAVAQGYMVKPMTMEVYPHPGETVTKVLELRNTSDASDIELRITPMLLTQEEQGNWQVIDPKQASDSPKDSLSSCLEWMELSRQTVRVSPLTTAKVQISFVSPPSARGFYGAALIVQSVPEPVEQVPDVLHIDMIVRFLVPVLVQIQGPPARTRVELIDAGMQFVPATDPYAEGQEYHPATTQVELTMQNTGQALARVGGQATIFRQAGDRWRRVTEAKLRERRMIPGAGFALVEDLGRRLPSGRYRIDAIATVDGRRLETFRQEIDFEGDPSVTEVAADVQLLVDPPRLEVQGAPGAKRSSYITVENPGEDALEVTCAIVQPKPLQGVALGEITGDEFSCHEWTTVSPERFSLRGGGQRRIRVSLAYPEDGIHKPYCYGTLNIAATYPDGQSAGNLEALIIAQDRKAKSAPALQGMGISLTNLEGNKNAVAATFGNIGDIHLDPQCKGSVTDATGMKLVKSFSLVREPGLVLPLGTPRFSGTIDFAGVVLGIYIIKVVAEFAGQEATQTMNVRVTQGSEYNFVEVIKR